MIWRAKEIHRLYRPFPSAWKTEERMMQTAATGKCMLIILRAYTPISIISPEALNMLKSCSGIACAMISPSAIIATA